MENFQQQQQQQQPPPQQLDLSTIKATKILGKGALGTVLLAHTTTTSPTQFALKVVEKSSTTATHRAEWETSILSTLKPHPFLPSLIGTFETDKLIGWAVPYCPGGDLNVLRHQQVDRVFSPAVIRFYLAEIICAIDRLHRSGLVYRDLKPENVLVQQSGHLTLTDFDLSRRLTRKSFGVVVVATTSDVQSFNHRKDLNPRHGSNFNLAGKTCDGNRGLFLTRKYWSNLLLYGGDTGQQQQTKKTTTCGGGGGGKSARVTPMSTYRKPIPDHNHSRNSFNNNNINETLRSNSFVGTEEYLSPEVILNSGHEFAVDWWALGVLAYEMLYGRTPFKGRNRKETYRNILMKEPEFPGKGGRMMVVLVDLIKRLLEKDPVRRIGFHNGAKEIKGHGFFSGLKWEFLTEVVRPPFVPLMEEVVEVDCGGGFDVREYFNGVRKVVYDDDDVWEEEEDEDSVTEF